MDKQPTSIVKRSPEHIEPYDERKLYASVYASCLSVRTPVGSAELTAEKVCQDLLPWVGSKQEITSLDIRTHAHQHFKIYNPDAAYMYLHHRIMA